MTNKNGPAGIIYMDEERLWFELDKIAVRESNPEMNIAKAQAAENMMKYLKKPSYEQCRQMYIEDGV